jgi:UDP-glucose 4-epimerase
VNYLVTGGAGFIGSHIVDRLLADGHRVRILDDFSTGRDVNIAGFASRVELVKGTVADGAAVAKAMEGVDGVFHQAAIPSVPRSVAAPLVTHRSIVDGTLMILEEMRRLGAKAPKMIMASSSSIYGESEILPKQEDMKPEPLSPYAVAKLDAEHYTLLYARQYGLKTVALRYFNVFGPRQDPTSEYSAVIPRFITAVLKGDQPTIYGDGGQSRDFTYVANVVEANLRAMKSDVTGVTMNIALGSRVTLLELLERIGVIVGRKVDPKFLPARPGDIRHSYASVERAKQLLKFEPVVDTEAGLRKTVEWFRSEGESK